MTAISRITDPDRLELIDIDGGTSSVPLPPRQATTPKGTHDARKVAAEGNAQRDRDALRYQCIREHAGELFGQPDLMEWALPEEIDRAVDRLMQEQRENQEMEHRENARS